MVEALTVREVARRAKVTENTVRRWIREGRLRAVMPGGESAGYRIADTEVDQLLGLTNEFESATNSE